jgi:hypothetical protein
MSDLRKVSLLQTLRSAQPYGVPEPVLLTQVRLAGHRDLTVPELQTELRSLADQGLTLRLPNSLGGDRWRITDLGLSKLTEAGV